MGTPATPMPIASHTRLCFTALLAGRCLGLRHSRACCAPMAYRQTAPTRALRACASRRVSLVAEEFLRMLHACGMPPADADMIHGSGATVGGLLMQASREPVPCPCSGFTQP